MAFLLSQQCFCFEMLLATPPEATCTDLFLYVYFAPPSFIFSRDAVRAKCFHMAQRSKVKKVVFNNVQDRPEKNVLSMCSERVFLWRRSHSGWKSKEKTENKLWWARKHEVNSVCGQGLVAVKLLMKNKQWTCMKIFGYTCLCGSTVTLVSFFFFNLKSCKSGLLLVNILHYHLQNSLRAKVSSAKHCVEVFFFAVIVCAHIPTVVYSLERKYA